MMPGIDLADFQQALLEAFDENGLEMMVRIRLNERLPAITGRGPVKYIIFQLLEWAESQGEPVVAELARAAYLERPRNEKIRRIYEKFGMAPTVSFQEAGTSLAGAPQHVTAKGLEAIVSPRLRAVDMGVWRDKMARIEGQVCRIEFNGNAMGTGFLVGPDLLLTNYHVLERPIEGELPAAQVSCRFDYKVLADGSRSEGVVVHLHDANWCIDFSRYTQAEASNRPDMTLPTGDELDYSLARLARPIGNEPVGMHAGSGSPPRGWIEVPEVQPPLDKEMPLLIAQHPDGSPLKLALDTRGVLGLNTNGTRVRYATNTDHGSSGSPCFNMDWALVALHHMGDPMWMKPAFNQGIPIGVIRERIGTKVEFLAL